MSAIPEPVSTPSVSRTPWAVAAAAAPKLCEGGTVKLAPLKLSELKRQDTNGSLASTDSAFAAAVAAPTGYVAPHKRKEEEAKPKEFKADDLGSDAAFPTLGSTPKKPVTPGGASWGQIRSKLTTPIAATPVSVASSNPFAALEDESSSVPQTPKTPMTPSILSFSAMLKDRIKKDEEAASMAALAAIEEETDDPMRMSHARLQREGWAVLKLPPLKDAAARKAWYEARAASVASAPTTSVELPFLSYKTLRPSAAWDNTAEPLVVG